jgi:hypothetical protein
MVLRTRHLPLVFVALVVVGSIIGFELEPWVGLQAKRPSIVLLGSGNVHPFLRDNVPNAVWTTMDPLWIDEGSGDALVNAFSVFNFGRSVSVDAKNRVGFIAMSSNGTKALSDIFADPGTESDRKLRNKFLSIIVAKQPLAVLYRHVSSSQLHVAVGSRLPTELGAAETSFHYVSMPDLRNIIEDRTGIKFTRYFPGANSGTKTLFETAAAKDQTTWGNAIAWADGDDVKEVPDYLEDLGDKAPFIELVSEPQEPHKSDSLSQCKRLREHQIEVAIICTGTEGCEHIIPADYALVFKLEAASGNEQYEYRIPNKSECTIARVFAPNNVRSDCWVDSSGAQTTGNIVTLTLPKFGLPSYMRCLE